MQKIYLDQASTSFPKSPSVADAVYQYLSGCAVNVGRGGYRAAYSVEEQIFETREQLRRLFHFTSGKGKNVIFIILLSGLMIPVQTTVIPIFIMYKEIGLMDTRLGIILPLLINPLGIFIMKQFMESIPKSYDEAAKLDGATHVSILFRIIAPMTKPALVTVAVLAFVASWNDFYRPLIFITSPEKMTLPLGMTALSGLMRNTSISIILAGILISSVPLILIYAFGQKYFVQGISLSGLKG